MQMGQTEEGWWEKIPFLAMSVAMTVYYVH